MERYPDAGPDSDKTATDPACGVRTYEGHKGTDIAIADKAAMDRGVNVLAAHEGTVMRVRNAEEDHFPVTKEQLDKIKADKKAKALNHKDLGLFRCRGGEIRTRDLLLPRQAR